MIITAVIPIRKGSQRVPDKNLRPFAGKSLLEVKIDELLQVEELDTIIVNTNSEEATAIVLQKYPNTKVQIQKREEYYASSQCSGSEFFHHLGEVTDTDIFVYAPCTSPFISKETISSCIQMFLTLDGACHDCVSTVNAVKDFLWLDGKPINYDPKRAPNSQNLPDIKALNFGCTVISRDDLIRNCNIIGQKPKFIETDEIESIDIDTPLDFFISEELYIKTRIKEETLLV